MLLFALGTFFTIMSNLFVIGEAEFFAHKQKMETKRKLSKTKTK